MPEFDPVPLPRYDGPETAPQSLIADITAWIGSDALRHLVNAFGGDPLGRDPDSYLDYLDAFSAEHWDFRAGRERFETRAKELSAPCEAEVRAAARALGLGGIASPNWERYTHVLVLGGLAGSCLLRADFAARLLKSGVTADRVTGVGGFRPLTEAEVESAARTGLDCGRFEVDAMAAGLKRAFGIAAEPEVEIGGDPHREPERAWQVAAYASEGRTVHVIAAPSSQPERRRADTVDTCRFWADRVAGLVPGDRILVVTSAPFVPFQHCEAIAHMGLPHGCGIDTVGVDHASAPEPHLRQEYTASAYLQEVRSAIRSMRRLHSAAQRHR
ncbi:hypothetical protein [Glycomyces buryatensis]|uniref:Uncharacterized protein n=1 Tax=Glycomyces buryatensis TaxID=2570927 RepID=A0A4S8QFJ4_9ACTN|nr:hypothetical protein [Glycomyces buryatensis]THV41705.1 hypothetical protein FAB82_09940 [Glycomyces buryatensis]